jgi:16S rRNA (adenine1518-N6/adenine1519-N6)-dimethyltransferase
MSKSAKLGQNFLHDKNIANKIINVFLPQPGPVLEIGAGPGILSAMLLEKIPAAAITLVEIDRFLAQRLKERFGERSQILEKNILEIDLAALFPEQPVAVIGNLPYHISKELIDWFIAQRAAISAAVLMLQKDFVDKLLSPAGTKKYNAQSVVFQLLFLARRCFNVSAGSFTPAPKVTSTVIAIRPIASPLQTSAVEFYDFVRLCFAERRKTLLNNLVPHFEKQVLSAIAVDCAISDHTRAEQLPADRFLAFFAALKKSAADRQR